jgi:hypothetical protein
LGVVPLHSVTTPSSGVKPWQGSIWRNSGVNVGRDACSVTWNLCTNSAFGLRLRKKRKTVFELAGRRTSRMPAVRHLTARALTVALTCLLYLLTHVCRLVCSGLLCYIYTGIPGYSALHLALFPKSTVVQYCVADFNFYHRPTGGLVGSLLTWFGCSPSNLQSM